MAVNGGCEIRRPRLKRFQQTEGRDCDIGPVSGRCLLPGGQLNNALTFGRRGGIDEAGSAELDLCGVDGDEGDVGRQQHHGAGAFLKDDIGRAEDGEQDAGREIETEGPDRIDVGRFVVDGDVDDVVRHDVAAEGRDALDLARKSGEPLQGAGRVNVRDPDVRDGDS